MVELVYKLIDKSYSECLKSLEVRFKFFLVHKHIYIYIYMDANTDHFTPYMDANTDHFTPLVLHVWGNETSGL